MRQVFIAFLFFSSWAHALPMGIEKAIKRSGIPKKDISIYIKDAGESNRIVASLNAVKSRTPASVIKVLATYASILKLGFDYRWPTKFYARGDIYKGVLNGDLIVKGFGDPTLNSTHLKEIVRKIKAQGIKKITGDIVIDRSYFKVGTRDSSKFDENPYSPYNAMPDAMMFNERVSTICIEVGKNSVSKKNPDGSYKLINNIKAVNKPCKGRYSWPGIKIDKSKTVPKVLLQGKMSKHCEKRNICKVITKPYKSFYYALKDSLKKAGVEVDGYMKLQKTTNLSRLLFTHYSSSLEKIISKTSKKSNNLYARHLLLLLGAKQYSAPATLEKGRRAIEYILRSKRAIAWDELKIDNGSGLSRSAKMSAKTLADMYDNAYERYGQRWMDTLSIAGVDGTIKKRFRGTIVKNKAWMKTGTLKRVKNIGGYVKNSEGMVYTVVILVNTKQGNWRASQLQNDIMVWLAKTTKKPSEESNATVREESTQVAYSNNASLSQSQKYYVQVGSFVDIPSKKYLQSIESLDLSYRIRYTYKHRVLIGPYSDEQQARKALSVVRKYINSDAFLLRD